MNHKKASSLIADALNCHLGVGSSFGADPWHRPSTIDADCFLLVEFCERIGPRPILLVQTSENCENENSTPPHLDTEALSMWLMTADYQALNQRPNQRDVFRNHRTSDVSVVLSNEEHGLHAFAQHFTLFDIEARGFLRPFCLAYLSKDDRKLIVNFQKIRLTFDGLLTPIKVCNKYKFRAEMESASKAFNSMEASTVSSYYELYYGTNTESTSNSENEQPKKTHQATVLDQSGDQTLHSRCRQMKRDVEDVKSIIDASLETETSDRHFDHTNGINVQRWIGSQLFFGAENNPSLDNDDNSDVVNNVPSIILPNLKPIEDLCPCECETMKKNLKVVLDQFKVFTTSKSTNSRSRTLFIGQEVLLKLPALNIYDRNPSCLSENTDLGQKCSKTIFPSNSTVLVEFASKIDHILFPILTGQFMLICASEFRQSQAEKLITILTSLIPHSNGNFLEKISAWHIGDIDPSLLVDFKLIGLKVEPESNWEDHLPFSTNLQRFVASMDLEKRSLQCVPYEGGFLDILTDPKILKLHKTDATYVEVIKGIIRRLSQIAFVLYNHIYVEVNEISPNATNFTIKNRPKLKSGSTSKSKMSTELFLKMHKFADKFKLTKSDMKIVKYFVELLKNAAESESMHESTSTSYSSRNETSLIDSMVLQYGSNVEIKL